MIIVENAGQRLVRTNYWTSEHAARGLFYLTWNAGAGRLLVPDAQKSMLREMRSAEMVIVSSGPWIEHGDRPALELLFEDESDSPFCLHLVAEQTDRMLPDTDQGGGFVITAWTRGGEKGRWPWRYRKVDAIPCLDSWTEH